MVWNFLMQPKILFIKKSCLWLFFFFIWKPGNVSSKAACHAPIYWWVSSKMLLTFPRSTLQPSPCCELFYLRRIPRESRGICQSLGIRFMREIVSKCSCFLQQTRDYWPVCGKTILRLWYQCKPSRAKVITLDFHHFRTQLKESRRKILGFAISNLLI